MQIKQQLVQQFNKRRKPITMLVIHSYASEDFFESCQRNEVSSHYEIDIDGNITQLVKEENRAWHAGAGSWRGIDNDINSHSIGIEVWNKTLGQSPFPQKQIDNLINLCQDIIKRHNIKPENIVGHSDIAPTRKPDPGHFFPWQALAKQGIGLWYNIKNASLSSSPLRGEDSISKRQSRIEMLGEDGKSIKDLLSTIGYSTENLPAAAYAFCRRWLPEFVQTDPDIMHLVNNVLPTNFDFMKEEKFLTTLKAVAYEYKKTASTTPS